MDYVVIFVWLSDVVWSVISVIYSLDIYKINKVRFSRVRRSIQGFEHAYTAVKFRVVAGGGIVTVHILTELNV